MPEPRQSDPEPPSSSTNAHGGQSPMPAYLRTILTHITPEAQEKAERESENVGWLPGFDPKRYWGP